MNNNISSIELHIKLYNDLFNNDTYFYKNINYISNTHSQFLLSEFNELQFEIKQICNGDEPKR